MTTKKERKDYADFDINADNECPNADCNGMLKMNEESKKIFCFRCGFSIMPPDIKNTEAHNNNNTDSPRGE